MAVQQMKIVYLFSWLMVSKEKLQMKTFIIKQSFLFIITAFALSTSVYAADYPAPGNFQRGAKIWVDNCGRCHNIRGAKELRDDQWISTMFHMRIRGGLTGQETRDVLTFMLGSNTLASKTVVSDASSPASTTSTKGSGLSGKAIYSQTCIACHAAGGTGAFPGVPDFTKASGVLGKSDSVLLKHVAEGFQSQGSPMAMPPKGGNPVLTQDDVKAVLGYIRSTFGR